MRRLGPTLAIAITLYLAQSGLLLYLRESLFEHSPVLYEEITSNYTNPAWLDQRLQTDRFGTNFGAYAVFWLGWKLWPGADLHTPRILKGLLMAALPALLFLIAQRRWHWGPLSSIALALSTAWLPGILFFSTISIDIGLELFWGLVAVYLALGARRWQPFAAGLAAGMSVLSYASGIHFVLLAALLLAQARQWHWRPLASFAMGILPVALWPILWCQNIQVLFVGGGRLDPSGIREVARILWHDFLRNGGSYYYPLPRFPALGPAYLGLLAFPSMLWALWKWQKHWPWILFCFASLGLALLTGSYPGMRRCLPLFVGLGVLSASLLRDFGLRFPKPAWAFTLIPLLLLANSVRIGRSWEQEALPMVNEPFLVPGPALEQTLYDIRNGFVAIPTDIGNMRPLYSLLYWLGGERGKAPFPQLYGSKDGHKVPIPVNAPRFSEVRKTLDMTP